MKSKPHTPTVRPPTAAELSLRGRRQAEIEKILSERRRDSRLGQRFSFALRFERWAEFRRSYTHDGGRGGIQFAMKEPPVVESIVELTLEFPTGERVRAQAQVRHVLPPNAPDNPGESVLVGAEFLELDEEARRTIAAALGPDPVLAEGTDPGRHPARR